MEIIVLILVLASLFHANTNGKQNKRIKALEAQVERMDAHIEAQRIVSTAE